MTYNSGVAYALYESSKKKICVGINTIVLPIGLIRYSIIASHFSRSWENLWPWFFFIWDLGKFIIWI